jgi:hypothetical protein
MKRFSLLSKVLPSPFHDASNGLFGDPHRMGLVRDTKLHEERIPPPAVVERDFMHGPPGKDEAEPTNLENETKKDKEVEKGEKDDTEGVDDFNLDEPVAEISPKELERLTEVEYRKLLNRFPWLRGHGKLRVA